MPKKRKPRQNGNIDNDTGLPYFFRVVEPSEENSEGLDEDQLQISKQVAAYMKSVSSEAKGLPSVFQASQTVNSNKKRKIKHVNSAEVSPTNKTETGTEDASVGHVETAEHETAANVQEDPQAEDGEIEDDGEKEKESGSAPEESNSTPEVKSQHFYYDGVCYSIDDPQNPEKQTSPHDDGSATNPTKILPKSAHHISLLNRYNTTSQYLNQISNGTVQYTPAAFHSTSATKIKEPPISSFTAPSLTANALLTTHPTPLVLANLSSKQILKVISVLVKRCLRMQIFAPSPPRTDEGKEDKRNEAEGEDENDLKPKRVIAWVWGLLCRLDAQTLNADEIFTVRRLAREIGTFYLQLEGMERDEELNPYLGDGFEDYEGEWDDVGDGDYQANGGDKTREKYVGASVKEAERALSPFEKESVKTNSVQALTEAERALSPFDEENKVTKKKDSRGHGVAEGKTQGKKRRLETEKTEEETSPVKKAKKEDSVEESPSEERTKNSEQQPGNKTRNDHDIKDNDQSSELTRTSPDGPLPSPAGKRENEDSKPNPSGTKRKADAGTPTSSPQISKKTKIEDNTNGASITSLPTEEENPTPKVQEKKKNNSTQHSRTEDDSVPTGAQLHVWTSTTPLPPPSSSRQINPTTTTTTKPFSNKKYDFQKLNEIKAKLQRQKEHSSSSPSTKTPRNLSTQTPKAEEKKDVLKSLSTEGKELFKGFVDMTLTIVGEVFGQRDLLDLRDVIWDSVEKEGEAISDEKRKETQGEKRKDVVLDYD